MYRNEFLAENWAAMEKFLSENFDCQFCSAPLAFFEQDTI